MNWSSRATYHRQRYYTRREEQCYGQVLGSFKIFTARHVVREGNVFIRVFLSVCSTLGGGSHVNFAYDVLGHSIAVYSIAVYKSIMG